MSIAARHLETRRPRKDRDVTWSRRACDGGMQWTLWRRDCRRAIHCVAVTVSLIALEASPWIAGHDLRVAHRKLRDFVDEIDLAAMDAAQHPKSAGQAALADWLGWIEQLGGPENVMKVKDLIKELLDEDMDSEVYVRTGRDGTLLDGITRGRGSAAYGDVYLEPDRELKDAAD